MNRLLTCVAVLVISLSAVSCADTREELTINKDGSGLLAVNTDVSKLVSLIKSFGGDSSVSMAGMDRAVDTVMLLKDFMDTTTSIAAADKAVLRTGSVHVLLDARNNTGKIDVSFPYSSQSNLQQLYSSLVNAAGSMKNITGKMSSGMPGGGNDSSSIPQLTTVYDISVKKGSYSRTVNADRYAAFAKMMKPEEMSQAAGMIGPMSYTLVINLPSPALQVSNSHAVLSADKKTVTMTSDLLNVFQHPELMEIRIGY